MLSLLLLLALRLLWQVSPGLPFAFVFWGTAMVVNYLDTPSFGMNVGHVGAFLNLVVIVANEGFMPVIGSAKGSSFSVWKPADENSRLLLLADRSKWRGCSIGDFLIITGLLISIFGK